MQTTDIRFGWAPSVISLVLCSMLIAELTGCGGGSSGDGQAPSGMPTGQGVPPPAAPAPAVSLSASPGTVSGGSGGSLTMISPAALPNATNGGGYFYLLQASGGTPPYTWSMSSKTGATSWTVTPDGWLEGAPTANESDSIAVSVTDSASHSAQGTFTVTVNSTLAVMNQNFLKGGISLPSAAVGTAYSHILQAAGGSSPYSWSIASGSLPAGLTLSSAGVISGTPTASGTVSGI